jgi:hypothetical protein
MAKRLGLIDVEHWKQASDWNGPNRIRIVSREWLTWLTHGRKETVKNLTTTHRPVFKPRNFSRGEGSERGYPNKEREEVGGNHGAGRQEVSRFVEFSPSR